MKKSIAVITAVVVLTVSGLVFAEMNDKGKEMMPDKKEMMEGKKSDMMGMCPMMKSMMERSVVASNDGGIIIVTGNKLTKYDKDLNVIKEVELKMDMDGMKKMMENMKGMCPMMGKGMMGNMDKDAESTAVAAAPAKEVDHASHH